MRSRCIIVVAVLAACAPVAAAQDSPPAPPAAASRDAALRARYQLRVMEGVLENAVQHGIQTVAGEMRLVSPDVIFFGSPSRARGFRLDGYGVFFDVDVPTLRPSVVWSVRQLSKPEMSRALQSLRRAVASAGDAGARREAEQALRLVELQVGPVGEPETARGEEPRRAEPAPQDPAEAYERAVMRALSDAILDYGNTLSLLPEDWLGVAARANDVGLGASADAVTVLIKIRGSDLEALHKGAISRDEARSRMVTTEF